MTKEQYQRALQIGERLENLARVKKEIDDITKHRLWYAEKSSSGSDYRLTSEWVMRYISELLDKHDTEIRQEIDEEIKRLKEEIKML